MAKFITNLQQEEVDDSGRLKRLTAPLEYQSDLIGKIVVPAGFVYDEESIARLPILYTLFKGTAIKPSAIHDYLYETKIVDRATADAVFLEAMDATGVSWWRRKAMYAAVRSFGWRHY